MAASNDLARVRESVQLGSRNQLPVKASTNIYQDTFVGLSGGYARPLVAGDKFAGIATKRADNSAVATDGAIDVEVENGLVVILPVTGASATTDFNSIVYASDDQTATLTALNNTAIGVVKRWITSTTCAVRLFTETELALV